MFKTQKGEQIPKIKQEIIEGEEKTSMDDERNNRSWKCERAQLPMTRLSVIQFEKEKIHTSTPISTKKEEEASGKMNSDTSEDISKLPSLPEDDDQAKSNDSCEEKKLTNKLKKNSYDTKRNKNSIRKRLIEIEYCKELN